MSVVFNVDFGLYHGVLFGNNFPVASGVVSADATSGKLVPASAAEWVAFNALNGISLLAPTNLYLCQEASGNPADSIGVATLTATGVTYAKAISGWSRTALSGTGSANATLTNASFNNSATSSFMVLMYLQFDAATVGTRSLFAQGNPLLQIPDTKIRLREGGSLASTVNAHNGAVHPIVVAFNITASTIKLYSDLEKLAITYSASTGSSITFNPSTTADPGVSDILYVAAWTGAAAETTDAEIKKLITGLGYSPSWS